MSLANAQSVVGCHISFQLRFILTIVCRWCATGFVLYGRMKMQLDAMAWFCASPYWLFTLTALAATGHIASRQFSFQNCADAYSNVAHCFSIKRTDVAVLIPYRS
ncbi:MAG: hypothetical protein WAT12_08495 [Candidatus Nitrotoga sp.]